MYFTTEGIVLRETDYQEADRLLTVLTRDRGKITLRARGVKRKNSPLKSGCQLLAFSEFTVFENKGKCVIQEATAKEMFLSLRSDIEQLSLASYFAQVTDVLCQEDDPDPELLSLCLNSLFALSRGTAPALLIKAAFEFRAISQAGFMPALDGCSICGMELPDRFCVSGVLRCATCGDQTDLAIRLPMSAGTLQALRYVAFCPMKRLFSFRLSDAGMHELSDITETYLLTQLERDFYTLDFYKSLYLHV